MRNNDSCPLCQVPCKDFILHLNEIFQYRELKNDTANTPQQKQMDGHAINNGMKDIRNRKTEAILEQLFQRFIKEIRRVLIRNNWISL